MKKKIVNEEISKYIFQFRSLSDALLPLNFFRKKLAKSPFNSTVLLWPTPTPPPTPTSF